MKKILCFALALLLCLSSVCTAFASSSDSGFGGTGGSLGNDHGGTGGSIDWDKLQPCDDELLNKAKDTLNYMIFPDKAGVAAELLSLLGSSDLDDDTKNYMDDNLKDNVKTDGTYFYYSPTYIQNINQKVQNRVHALNGYYLYDSIGARNYNTVNSLCKSLFKQSCDYLTGTNYNNLQRWLSDEVQIAFVGSNNSYFLTGVRTSNWKDYYYFFIDISGRLCVFDSLNNKVLSDYIFCYSDYTFRGLYGYGYSMILANDLEKFIGCLGSSQKVFIQYKIFVIM